MICIQYYSNHTAKEIRYYCPCFLMEYFEYLKSILSFREISDVKMIAKGKYVCHILNFYDTIGNIVVIFIVAPFTVYIKGKLYASQFVT